MAEQRTVKRILQNRPTCFRNIKRVENNKKILVHKLGERLV